MNIFLYMYVFVFFFYKIYNIYLFNPKNKISTFGLLVVSYILLLLLDIHFLGEKGSSLLHES